MEPGLHKRRDISLYTNALFCIRRLLKKAHHHQTAFACAVQQLFMSRPHGIAFQFPVSSRQMWRTTASNPMSNICTPLHTLPAASRREEVHIILNSQRRQYLPSSTLSTPQDWGLFDIDESSPSTLSRHTHVFVHLLGRLFRSCNLARETLYHQVTEFIGRAGRTGTCSASTWTGQGDREVSRCRPQAIRSFPFLCRTTRNVSALPHTGYLLMVFSPQCLSSLTR